GRWEFFCVKKAAAIRSTPPPRDGSSPLAPASDPFNARRSSSFTATEGESGKPSSWSGAVTQILCVRLKNWPIDRLRRQLQRVERSHERVATTPADFVIPTTRRIRGRPTNDPPRQRRWTHQMWQDGPRDLKVTSAGRPKLFMPTRGICMTPAIRPSAAKPTSVPKVDEPPLAIVRTVANRQEIVAVSPAALNLAIRSGLTLTEGRALCGGLVAFGHDPLRDARALEALARWMMRFSPAVCLPVGATPASRSTRSVERFAAAPRRDTGVAPTENL